MSSQPIIWAPCELRGRALGRGYRPFLLLTPTSSLQQEHWFEKALRDKKGFIIKQMKEDGACLFRAVGESLPQPSRA